MKQITFILLMLVSRSLFGQTNQPPVNPPLINFVGVPFDVAFHIKKMILNEYLNNNANPSGLDLVLLQDIDRQINANGVLAGSKLYKLNSVPMKYYKEVVRKIIEEDPYKAMKTIERFGRKKAILKQMKTQYPLIIKQIMEMSGGGITGNYVQIDTLITN